jgi:glucose/arabinose dehydrogenase
MLAPEYNGDGKKEAPGYTAPIMGLPAHWAPNDLLFYTGSQFPERYRHGAFVAFHGSTNRNPYPQGGYVVGFIPFNNGKPSGELEIFADGFTGLDVVQKMEDVKYRPMGLAEGPDGSLYISESKKGKIWRIQFKGDRQGFGPAQLYKMAQRKTRSYVALPDTAGRIAASR